MLIEPAKNVRIGSAIAFLANLTNFPLFQSTALTVIKDFILLIPEIKVDET